MFHRIFFENWVSLFPLVALITALSIYATIFYRALRMKAPQIEHFAHLPFESETSVSADESK
ncbi:MAG: hypothetical protein H2172_07905 [Opitutus sp.]|jgi:hypothetical protein|nr:hypothetical protein [Opitutus sp.]MCS6245957.1 hypothetical protein [Opitutus sp.]MCS6272903.1 hypothetical protein [Opitutus sp.]MCS6275962.1 hypothetical protein [Opitutus sp.]MCS6301057.1 hypothetical protein [Opitutus sp.]